MTPQVEVSALGDWRHAWDGTCEVRLGPLSPEQAETLSDDLGYEAVAKTAARA